jgi:Mrp family chromosome partitioning ATPase
MARNALVRIEKEPEMRNRIVPDDGSDKSSWPNTGPAAVTASSNGAGNSIRNAARGPDGELTLFDEAGATVHVALPAVTESLRYMLARLRLDEIEIPTRLGLTSAISGEGVTYVTRSLALVLTNDAARNVCIVDLNWADPAEWSRGVPEAGLAEVIRDSLPLEQAFVPTGNLGLSFLPAGTAPIAERPVLANSPELRQVLAELSQNFHHVLLDLPAVHATSEALMLAEQSDALAFVVNQGVTPEAQIKAALDQLGGVETLGIILNRSVSKIPRFVRRRMAAI